MRKDSETSSRLHHDVYFEYGFSRTLNLNDASGRLVPVSTRCCTRTPGPSLRKYCANLKVSYDVWIFLSKPSSLFGIKLGFSKMQPPEIG